MTKVEAEEPTLEEEVVVEKGVAIQTSSQTLPHYSRGSSRRSRKRPIRNGMVSMGQ